MVYGGYFQLLVGTNGITANLDFMFVQTNCNNV